MMIPTDIEKISALIFSDSDFMREGLRTLLTTLPDVRVVGSIDGEMNGAKLSNELCPQVILVDCTPFNGKGMEFLRNVKTEKTHTRCLAIVESYEYSKQALAIGAEGVLIQGFSSSDLKRVLNRIMKQPVQNGKPEQETGDSV